MLVKACFAAWLTLGLGLAVGVPIEVDSCYASVNALCLSASNRLSRYDWPRSSLDDSSVDSPDLNAELTQDDVDVDVDVDAVDVDAAAIDSANVVVGGMRRAGADLLSRAGREAHAHFTRSGPSPGAGAGPLQSSLSHSRARASHSAAAGAGAGAFGSHARALSNAYGRGSGSGQSRSRMLLKPSIAAVFGAAGAGARARADDIADEDQVQLNEELNDLKDTVESQALKFFTLQTGIQRFMDSQYHSLGLSDAKQGRHWLMKSHLNAYLLLSKKLNKELEAAQEEAADGELNERRIFLRTAMTVMMLCDEYNQLVAAKPFFSLQLLDDNGTITADKLHEFKHEFMKRFPSIQSIQNDITVQSHH